VTQTYTLTECVAAQRELCDVNQCPQFASADGVCPYCRRALYGEGGFDLDYAGTQLVTYCRACNRSFVD